MCCIFTCCGWVIDLVQRFWVFAMSCVISGAVTCTLITASMSGIAMGYNYSLAEYIDLKDTNVSVYLKRGVFDDDIADDMEWRRAGHLPVAGQINDFNLATGENLDYATTNVPYGRRMDDSIFQSDDHHKYEGSLMKLTLKPVYDTPTPGEYAPPSHTAHPLQNNFEHYQMPKGVDELKNQQAFINQRKESAVQRLANARRMGMDNAAETTINHDERDFPREYPPVGIYPGYARRQMGQMQDGHQYGASARDQVPYRSIGDKALWVNPMVAPHKQLQLHDDESIIPNINEPARYPEPITLRQGPLRPSRPPPPKSYPTHTTIDRTSPDDSNYKISELQDFKSKFDQNIAKIDKQDSSSEEDELAQKLKQGKPPGEDYDEDFKGLPVRRRRHLSGRKFRTIPEHTYITKESKLGDNNLFRKLFNATDGKKDIQTEDNLINSKYENENMIKSDVEENLFDKIKNLMNRFVLKSKTTEIPSRLLTVMKLHTIPHSYTISTIL